jgi:uncharacterized protein (TIGR03083 family)
MDQDQLWAMIDGRRRHTADLLDGLTDAEWDRPSLCQGWTVRHVAAHLTLQQQGVGDALITLLRHPGVLRRPTLNGLIHNSALMQSRLPRAEITARIRAMIGSRRHNVGVTPRDTHTDIVLHGQDIALPLGKKLPLAPAEAAVAADRLWQTRPTRLSVVYRKLPLDGHRLVADDVDWQVGDGTEVRGPILALLLTLGGRTALLHQLHGPGADALRSPSTPSP